MFYCNFTIVFDWKIVFYINKWKKKKIPMNFRTSIYRLPQSVNGAHFRDVTTMESWLCEKLLSLSTFGVSRLTFSWPLIGILISSVNAHCPSLWTSMITNNLPTYFLDFCYSLVIITEACQYWAFTNSKQNIHQIHLQVFTTEEL